MICLSLTTDMASKTNKSKNLLVRVAFVGHVGKLA